MDGPSNNPGLTGAPSAPPPPPEVKVRTMRSDLESMAQSGGGLPHFQTVRVEGLAGAQKGASTPSPAVFASRTPPPGLQVARPPAGMATQQQPIPGEKQKMPMWMAVSIGVGVIVVLGVVGYFVYKAFVPVSVNITLPGPAASSTGATGGSTAAGAGAGTASTSSAASSPSFTHASVFKKPADQTIVLGLGTGGAATSASDLETFNQKLAKVLMAANKNANFVEIVPEHADGSGVSIGDLLAAQNAAVIDPQYLAAHFSPDATFFVYRDKNGWWPGYVIPLLPSENWLFLKNDVAKLESSPDLGNLFLGNAGTPAASFADGTASTTSVRTLAFAGSSPTGAAPGMTASFTYGWYQSYLIVSTSQAGFAQAIGRL